MQATQASGTPGVWNDSSRHARGPRRFHPHPSFHAPPPPSVHDDHGLAQEPLHRVARLRPLVHPGLDGRGLQLRLLGPRVVPPELFERGRLAGSPTVDGEETVKGRVDPADAGKAEGDAGRRGRAAGTGGRGADGGLGVGGRGRGRRGVVAEVSGEGPGGKRRVRGARPRRTTPGRIDRPSGPAGRGKGRRGAAGATCHEAQRSREQGRRPRRPRRRRCIARGDSTSSEGQEDVARGIDPCARSASSTNASSPRRATRALAGLGVAGETLSARCATAAGDDGLGRRLAVATSPTSGHDS